MVKIDVPKSVIDFDIGGKKFTLSLDDKSKGKYSEAFNQMSIQEARDNYKTDAEVSDVNQKLATLEAQYATSEDITESQYKKKRGAIEEAYYKKVNNRSIESGNKQIKLALQFLDYCFGQGSGDAIYDICGNSSIVLSKVIVQIYAEIESNTASEDFYAKYMNKIKDMKNNESDSEESTEVQQ